MFDSIRKRMFGSNRNACMMDSLKPLCEVAGSVLDMGQGSFEPVRPSLHAQAAIDPTAKQTCSPAVPGAARKQLCIRSRAQGLSTVYLYYGVWVHGCIPFMSFLDLGRNDVAGACMHVYMHTYIYTYIHTCSTVQYSTVQYSTVQYSTVQYISAGSMIYIHIAS